MPVSKAQIKATAKYHKEHLVAFRFNLNKEHDADVLEKLNSVPNKQGYIKELIRQDINKPKEQ